MQKTKISTVLSLLCPLWILVDTHSLYSGYVCGYGYPWISMDMDIHGYPQKICGYGYGYNSVLVPSAMMFVRRSVCLRRACVVIIRCTVVPSWVYGWIIKCSGHHDAKACPPIPISLFPVLRGTEMGYGCANYSLDVTINIDKYVVRRRIERT